MNEGSLMHQPYSSCGYSFPYFNSTFIVYTYKPLLSSMNIFYPVAPGVGRSPLHIEANFHRHPNERFGVLNSIGLTIRCISSFRDHNIAEFTHTLDTNSLACGQV